MPGFLLPCAGLAYVPCGAARASGARPAARNLVAMASRKPNPRRSNGTQRNALIKRVKREETHCHLCLRPVDTSLPPGRPDSPEVDEIIPVSRGGNPLDRANVRLSHRLCNQKRSGKPIGHPKLVTFKPLKTTRDW